MKISKKIMILTSLVTILPVLAGLIFWKQLPDTMVTHFGIDGTANGWSGKPCAVFGIPVFILVCHWICIAATRYDPKRQNISGKMMYVILWICPIVSVICGIVTYGASLGWKFNITNGMFALIGILFIVMGNYLPKCRHNYTVGIKLPWTLADEDNWNHTHRMAGKLCIAGGILMIGNGFLRQEWIFWAIMALLVLIPMGYSFFYYVSHHQ